MKDLNEPTTVTTHKGPAEPDPQVTELRQRVNEAFLEAGLLVKKTFQGTEYLAFSSDMKERGIDMVVSASRHGDNPASMTISIRTNERDLYEETAEHVQEIIEEAGIENVSWHQQRPLVPPRSKSSNADAETPAVADIGMPQLD